MPHFASHLPKVGDPIPDSGGLRYEAEDIANLASGGGTVFTATPTVITPDLARKGVSDDLSKLTAFNAALTAAVTPEPKTAQERAKKGEGLSKEEALEVFGTDFTGIQQRDGQFFPDVLARERVKGAPQAKTPEQQLQEFSQQADEELKTATAELQAMRARFSAANQAVISSIQNRYAVRRRDMEDINRRSLAALQTLGIRTGAARFAPELQVGLLSAEERAGIGRIAELDAEEAELVARANLAASEKDFKLMSEQMDLIEARRKEKQDLIKEQLKRAFEENKKVVERKEKANRRNLIISLMNAGLDAQAVAAQLQTAGHVVDFDEIRDAFGLKPKVKKPDVNAFTFEDASGVTQRVVEILDPTTGALISRRTEPLERGGATFKDRPLTLSEVLDLRDRGFEATVGMKLSDIQGKELPEKPEARATEAERRQSAIIQAQEYKDRAFNRWEAPDGTVIGEDEFALTLSRDNGISLDEAKKIIKGLE